MVADNASSSGFVLGPWNEPGPDLSNRGMIMEFDGRPVQIGSTAAILGDPLRSLVAAARMVGRAGFRLEAGWVVMAGAATAAQPLAAGVHVATPSRAWEPSLSMWKIEDAFRRDYARAAPGTAVLA